MCSTLMPMFRALLRLKAKGGTSSLYWVPSTLICMLGYLYSYPGSSFTHCSVPLMGNLRNT